MKADKRQFVISLSTDEIKMLLGAMEIFCGVNKNYNDALVLSVCNKLKYVVELAIDTKRRDLI